MVAGSLMYGGGMVLLGIVTEFWQFLVVYGVIMSLAQSVTMVPLMAAVSGWFRRRLGLGVGLLWAAGGAGAAVLAPLLGFLIEEVGWRGAFWTLGIGGGGIMLAMTLLFRNRPSDLGLRPYGTRPDDPPEVSISEAIARVRFKVFQRHMRRTRAYWNLPLVHAMGCIGHAVRHHAGSDPMGESRDHLQVDDLTEQVAHMGQGDDGCAFVQDLRELL